MLLTLIVIAVFLFVLDCTILNSLQETVEAVRSTFTATIEEMEPGKLPSGSVDTTMIGLA